jgi:subtilisin
MRRLRLVLIVAGCVIALPVPATGAGPEPSRPFVVSLRPDGPDPALFAAEEAPRLGFAVLHVYRAALRGFAAALTPSARAALSADRRVEAIEPDRVIAATDRVVPTGIRRVHADLSPTAGIGTTRGPTVDVNVAVVDSGIDSDHPDLRVVGGTNCIDGARDDDRYGHGTHVAGIIGALNKNSGVVGVAPGVRLWAVKVLDDRGDGTVSGLLCGIDWITASRRDPDPKRRIAVANLSVGGDGGDDGQCGRGDGDLLHQAICGSVADGVTYVAAAGKDHRDDPPGTTAPLLDVSSF